MPALHDYLESREKLPQCLKDMLDIALELSRGLIIMQLHQLAVASLEGDPLVRSDPDYRAARIIQLEWLLGNAYRELRRADL